MKALYFVFLLVPALAFADEEEGDPCHAQGGGVAAGYLCVAQKYRAADEKMTQEYRKALGRTQQEEAALRKNWPNTQLVVLLRTSQKAWSRFKDAECQFQGLSSTPSPWQAVQVEECKWRMTVERTEYLKGVHGS